MLLKDPRRYRQQRQRGEPGAAVQWRVAVISTERAGGRIFLDSAPCLSQA